MLKYVDQKTFEQEILKNEKPILVDFFAEWCGPCRMVAPILEKMGNEQTTFDIAKINVDENQELAMEYGVQSIPTMIVFKGGEVVDGMVGFSNEQAIIDLMNKHSN